MNQSTSAAGNDICDTDTSWTELVYYEVDEPAEASTDLFAEAMSDKPCKRNYTMPEYMAAETIQQTYKRYMAYRSAQKMKRITSVQKVVLAMAADTIKNTFRKCRLRHKEALKEQREIKVRFDQDIGPEFTLIDEPEQKSTRESLSDPHFIEVTEVTCLNLSKINWDSENDPYVEFVCNEWSCTTPIRWEGGSAVTWVHPGILIPVDYAADCMTVLINVYSANLVREPQLIGSGYLNFYLKAFVASENRIHHSREMATNLLNTTKPGKEQGRISLKYVLQVGKEFANLEAKLSAESLERVWKLQEADLVRLELLKRRKENEAADAAAVKREIEIERLATVGKRQNAEMDMVLLKMDEPQKAFADLPIHKTPLMKLKSTHNKKPIVLKAPETEPLYREVSESRRKLKADDVLQSAIVQDPKLFELRGNRKDIVQPPKSPTYNDIVVSAPEPVRRTSGKPSKIIEGLDLGEPISFLKSSIPRNPILRRSNQLTESNKQEEEIREHTLVIDEVFVYLKKSLGSVISIRAPEVILLLRALGFQPNSEISQEPLDLSLSNPLAFAGTLTAYVRRHQIFSDLDFECTEDMASKATENMNALLVGAWKKARFWILKSCKSSRDAETGKRLEKAVRPTSWSIDLMKQFLNIIQIPYDLNASLSGSSVLSLENVESLIAKGFNRPPSILVCRLKLYQSILQTLDKLWDYKSPRQHPGDILTQKLILFDDRDIGFHMKSSKKNGISINDNVVVRLVCADELLHSFMASNRAFAWNIPLDRLSHLAVSLAGLTGRVNNARSIGAQQKGVVWVDLFQNTCGNLQLLRDLGDLLDLSIIQVINSSKHFGLLSVCLPLQCFNISKSSREKPLSPLQSIDLGQRVTVAPLSVLKSSYSRFDWYDQPRAEDLLYFANTEGQVVSVVELDSSGRVGVALDVQKGTLVEAIPIEALRKSRKQKEILSSLPSIVHQSKSKFQLKTQTLEDNKICKDKFYADVEKENFPRDLHFIDHTIPLVEVDIKDDVVASNDTMMSLPQVPKIMIIDHTQSKEVESNNNVQSFLKPPSQRRPLYREDVVNGLSDKLLSAMNNDSEETKEGKQQSRPKSVPLKLKRFSWLNPSGPVFDIPQIAPQPPPPFEFEGKDFVPLTKTFGIPPAKLTSPRKSNFKYNSKDPSAQVDEIESKKLSVSVQLFDVNWDNDVANVVPKIREKSHGRKSYQQNKKKDTPNDKIHLVASDGKKGVSSGQSLLLAGVSGVGYV